MGASRVEAVWIWYYAGVNQKWTYGRYNKNGFTKDHLQINARAGELAASLYGLVPGTPHKHELLLKWHSGEVAGRMIWSSGRHTLRWDRTGGGTPWSAPAPWRMISNPSATTPSPLRGDGEATSAEGAIAAIEAFTGSKTRAYLLAVKLEGEDSALHVRTYIDDAPDDLAFASTELLPDRVRGLVRELGTRPTCVALDARNVAADPDVEDALRRLSENPNLLLTGPPGTGKSVLLDKIARYVESPPVDIFFDPAEPYDAWGASEDSPPPGKAVTVVLHPSYSYENLVVGLLPKVEGKTMSVGVTTGPLVNLAHYASFGNRAVLILDEFNRGNAAAVLGDALALLDKDKRGVAQLDLPAYGLPIEVPIQFATEHGRLVDPRFSLPESLWVVAAMNSSDRSVAPLDAALRRRFSIVELGPDYGLLAERLGAASDSELGAVLDEWTPGTVARLAVTLLRTLNSRIEAALGRDFTLGHSNFWHVGGATAEDALRALASAWDHRIVQTLRLALQDDDDTLAFILNAGKPDDSEPESATRAAWWKSAEVSFEQFARPRLEFREISRFDEAHLIHRELLRLAGV